MDVSSDSLGTFTEKFKIAFKQVENNARTTELVIEYSEGDSSKIE